MVILHDIKRVDDNNRQDIKTNVAILKQIYVGQAKWKCDKNPTCWRGEADVKQCTSEAIQVLTAQVSLQ